MSDKVSLQADRLKALREERGWSQRELSRRCGFGESAIRMYELSEIDPSATHVRKIAEQFGVSTDYLLGLTNQPHGFYGIDELSADEQAVLHALRRDGWLGALRVVTDRMAG